MAALSATAGTDLPKSVQEMSINGSEPPQEYIVKDATFGPVEASPPLGSIPIINISLFLPSSSHDAEQVENELLKLRSALSSSGCFQAIGHGISSSFLDKVRGVAKQFFSLPVEEKQKYSRAVNESEGYGNDVIVSEKQVLDWSYRLTLRVFPEDRRRLNLWPENPTDFGETLHEYAMRTKSVVDLLYKAMAKSLELGEDSFSKQFGDNTLMQARFNFYPPCCRPHQVLGVKPHTDRSGVTVLLQDGEVEGLQVLIEDKWVRVPIVPHALLVNLGDQMQIMSNGIFKSPMHRVVTNTEKMRMSVAMFNEPQPDREIGPVECLIDEKRPRLYRNVTNYGAINYECFQKGKIALETVRI
ncbi:protein SRG1-like [Corylus avellana]|uniref:protein SRG1-like n=1 Tax=Corylus avellana TaxID=13451 RepID=UPI00286BD508|nr:protein SRG1-like [Corylus avellana]